MFSDTTFVFEVLQKPADIKSITKQKLWVETWNCKGMLLQWVLEKVPAASLLLGNIAFIPLNQQTVLCQQCLTYNIMLHSLCSGITVHYAVVQFVTLSLYSALCGDTLLSKLAGLVNFTKVVLHTLVYLVKKTHTKTP